MASTSSPAALDFRDIHQHPPAAVQNGQPLPHDPSWDAHKVYFNEREKGPVTKGDDFDDFFDPRVMMSMDEKENQEGISVDIMETPLPEQHEDENLDPLGWPVDDFRSDRTTSAWGRPEEDGEDDDLNLLKKQQSSDEDDENDPHAAMAARLTHIVEGVAGVSVHDEPEDAADDEQDTSALFTNNEEEDGDISQENVVLNKYERIRIYETTGVDEESSVEEEEDPADEEEWEKDRDVTYIPQSTSLDEEDVDDDDGQSGNAMFALPPMMEQVADDFVASFPPSSEEEQANTTVPATAVPTFTIPPPQEKPFTTKAKGPLPLLRPPPAEKLAKWEEEKARASNFLLQQEQSSSTQNSTANKEEESN